MLKECLRKLLAVTDGTRWKRKRMARRASTAVPNVTNQAEKKTYRTRLGKRGNDQAKVSNDNENNNDNGITYLIFVIFRTPTPFRGLEIVRQKVRKFYDKNFSQQTAQIDIEEYLEFGRMYSAFGLA